MGGRLSLLGETAQPRQEREDARVFARCGDTEVLKREGREVVEVFLEPASRTSASAREEGREGRDGPVEERPVFLELCAAHARPVAVRFGLALDDDERKSRRVAVEDVAGVEQLLMEDLRGANSSAEQCA